MIWTHPERHGGRGLCDEGKPDAQFLKEICRAARERPWKSGNPDEIPILLLTHQDVHLIIPFPDERTERP